MTPDEYRAHASRLGLSILALGRVLKIGERTARRYASEDGTIPESVSLLLPKLTKGEVKKILKEREHG